MQSFVWSIETSKKRQPKARYGGKRRPPLLPLFAAMIKSVCLRTWPACCQWEREYIGMMAVILPNLKAFLRDTPFFGGLSDASLDLLASMLVELRFDVGATVVAEGEPGRSMF